MVREGRSWSGRERNCCFLNTRDGQFATVSAVSGLDVPDDSRGVAVTDWDQDGLPDLWITSRTAPRVRFFHNRTPAAGQCLAVTLRGVQCNRDAIGARLELFLGPEGKSKRIKSLRAGEGFLSQSSKWVYFGLGSETRIDRLVVRWPGGDAETFTGMSPGTRWLIEQGSGRAVALAPRGTKPRLVPSEVELPSSSRLARTVAVSASPLTTLKYVDFEGKPQSLLADTQVPAAITPKGTLINLWASWCSPCSEELKEFTQQEEHLRQAGVEVLALCVDDIADRADAGDSSAARKILDKLKCPFRSGVATRQLVRTLDTLRRSLVDLQSELPLPSSFLVDSQNRLAIVYKGPLAPRQLLEDVSLLNADAGRLREAAVPFPGTWITKPLPPYPQEIALKFFEQGETDEAVDYLRTYVRSADRQGVRTTVADLADVHFLLGRLLSDRGDTAESLSAYQEAVRINPRYRQARINLGELLLRQNRAAEAVKQFDAALRMEPDDASTLVALGVAHVRLRQPEEAVRCYQDALRLEPGHDMARANLARLHHARGELSQAVALYREILRHQPDSPSVANNLAWILATSEDASIYLPEEAVRWATKACEAADYQDPRFLTTLAAAYSETGRLKDAIITAKTAIRLAHAADSPKVAAGVEKHLRYYEAGRSYRQGHVRPSQ